MLQAKGLNAWNDDAYCTEEYAIIQAARYMGVAAWDLVDRPWWRQQALKAMTVEAQVRKILKEG